MQGEVATFKNAIMMLLAAAVLSGVTVAAAQSETTASIEVRVWQDVHDERDIYVSARPAGGSWRTLGTIALPLDDGESESGRFRYGDIALRVPIEDRAAPVTVQVRVWQDISDSARIYVSARPAGGSWGTLGTIRLLLDDGRSSNGRFRFGDISLEVTLPETSVQTIAGGEGLTGYRDGVGSNVRFGGTQYGNVVGVEVDFDGSLVVADSRNSVIRRVALDGTVTTIAGASGRGYRDGPVEEAQFSAPHDVALHTDGTIYVADGDNYRIRKISPGGMVTTLAGSDRGDAGHSEIRDGLGDQALFTEPLAIELDQYGDLYVVERSAIRRVAPSGRVTTVHSYGRWLSERTFGAPFLFSSLRDIGIDLAGNLYVIDGLNITRIDPDGEVSLLYQGEHPSLGGTLAYPMGMDVMANGTILLSNTGRHQIVRLTADGELRAIAGSGAEGFIEDTHRDSAFSLPTRLASAPDGSVFVVDQEGTVIRKILPARGAAVPLADHQPLPYVEGMLASILAGSGDQGLVDGRGSNARFTLPHGLAVDRSGNVLVADSANDAIRSIALDGTVTTLAGGVEGYRDGSCDVARFRNPYGIAVAPNGSIYVSENYDSRIRRIDPDGCSVTTVAGKPADAEEDNSGTRDGLAVHAQFEQPSGLALDARGNLYIADSGNNLIRLLSTDGLVSTVAGPPGGLRYNPGSFDGQDSFARFNAPTGIDVDDDGNVLFTESNNAIRMLDTDGYVSAVLRTPDLDEGGALSPFLNELALGPDGEIYVADGHFGRVLRITPEGEVAIVIDRNRGFGVYEGPWGLAVDSNGRLFVSTSRNVIWQITIQE